MFRIYIGYLGNPIDLDNFIPSESVEPFVGEGSWPDEPRAAPRGIGRRCPRHCSRGPPQKAAFRARPFLLSKSPL